MLANSLLLTIAGCGRRFFHHDGKVSRLDLDAHGRVWFVDSRSGRRIYTHSNHAWTGFSNGGTLRGLVEYLRDFITRGEPVPLGVFGPNSQLPAGLWGYGDDMAVVLQSARSLGIVASEPEPAATAPEMGP